MLVKALVRVAEVKLEDAPVRVTLPVTVLEPEARVVSGSVTVTVAWPGRLKGSIVDAAGLAYTLHAPSVVSVPVTASMAVTYLPDPVT